MMLSGVWFWRGRCTQRWFVESTTMWPSDGEFSAREVPLLYRHSYRIPFSIFRASCCRIILHLFYLLSRIRHVLAACCDPRASPHRTTCRRVAATSSSRSVTVCIVFIRLVRCCHRARVTGMHAILCGGDWLYNWGIFCGCIMYRVLVVGKVGFWDWWLACGWCMCRRALSLLWVGFLAFPHFVIFCDITHVL